MAPSVASQTKKLLASAIHKNRRRLCEWHLEHARVAPPPFYCSVDLRDSGHKIVPVDSNLYPAGFNNICPDDLRAAPPVLRAQIEAQASRLGLAHAPKRLLVIPEAHTSNTYYIENLYYLTQLLSEAGFDVRVGWYGAVPEGQAVPLALKSATDKEVLAYPIAINSSTITAGDFEPELVLLNNDFSSGYPKELDGVKQAILPSHTLGWHSRKKSEHFSTTTAWPRSSPKSSASVSYTHLTLPTNREV